MNSYGRSVFRKKVHCHKIYSYRPARGSLCLRGSGVTWCPYRVLKNAHRAGIITMKSSLSYRGYDEYYLCYQWIYCSNYGSMFPGPPYEVPPSFRVPLATIWHPLCACAAAHAGIVGRFIERTQFWKAEKLQHQNRTIIKGASPSNVWHPLEQKYTTFCLQALQKTLLTKEGNESE